MSIYEISDKILASLGPEIPLGELFVNEPESPSFLFLFLD